LLARVGIIHPIRSMRQIVLHLFSASQPLALAYPHDAIEIFEIRKLMIRIHAKPCRNIPFCGA